MTSPKIPAFTVRAVRMTVLAPRPAAARPEADVQPLARAATETFAAAAEIARSFAITYGYPEGLLLSQMEWAEQCCTGRGPSGSPPAYSFGSPGLLGNPSSWVAISIESAEYTAETARLAREIASEQEEAGVDQRNDPRRPDQLRCQSPPCVRCQLLRLGDRVDPDRAAPRGIDRLSLQAHAQSAWRAASLADQRADCDVGPHAD